MENSTSGNASRCLFIDAQNQDLVFYADTFYGKYAIVEYTKITDTSDKNWFLI